MAKEIPQPHSPFDAKRKILKATVAVLVQMFSRDERPLRAVAARQARLYSAVAVPMPRAQDWQIGIRTARHAALVPRAFRSQIGVLSAKKERAAPAS